MKFKAEVRVELKPGVLDAEGKTTQKSLKLLGYPVSNVKKINFYEIEVDVNSAENARAVIEDACRRLLANPVIHNYGIEITEMNNSI